MDLAFADVVATSSDPRLGEIRLAWWRERLEQLDTGMAAPAEPRLQAIVDELCPRGVAGEELSKLEDAWLPLIEPFPWAEMQVEGLRLRGRILFGIGARLLGGPPQLAEPAGELWSLLDGATHCTDPHSRGLLVEGARAVDMKQNAPRELRPLTILAPLAAADVAHPSSGFARGMAAIRHRMTGKFRRL